MVHSNFEYLRCVPPNFGDRGVVYYNFDEQGGNYNIGDRGVVFPNFGFRGKAHSKFGYRGMVHSFFGYRGMVNLTLDIAVSAFQLLRSRCGTFQL